MEHETRNKGVTELGCWRGPCGALLVRFLHASTCLSTRGVLHWQWYALLGGLIAEQLSGQAGQSARCSARLPYFLVFTIGSSSPPAAPSPDPQVTCEYKKEGSGTITPLRVHTILISTQHSEDVTNEQIRKELMEHVRAAGLGCAALCCFALPCACMPCGLPAAMVAAAFGWWRHSTELEERNRPPLPAPTCPFGLVCIPT